MARGFLWIVVVIVLLRSGALSAAQTSSEVDVTPPSVILTSPANGITTRKAEINVKGRVSDELSGIASATCNGQPATIVKKTVRCSVTLLPGVNAVILQASDVAGNSASAGVQITRVVRRTTAITLTPGHKTMLVDEEATLSLVDDSGVQVLQAGWETSDTSVVTLSGDDPPLLKAVGAGTATVTAKKNRLTSATTIAVVAGTELAPGTTRWSVPARPGLTMEAPIYANRVDETTPDLFLVETETWGEATLRGINAEGNVMWRQHSPGIPLMGDSFGGVIAGVLYDVNQGAAIFRSLLRLGVAGGVPPWRYESAGILLRPAQAPDGTLYAIELTYGGVDTDGSEIWDKHATVVDGTTGRLISRWPLAREILAFVSANDGLVLGDSLTCRSSRTEMSPETVGPIVGSDGRGYLLVRRRVTMANGSCIPFNGLNYFARTQDVGVDLIALSAANVPMVHSLYALECSSGELQPALCDLAPDIYQLLPDGVGGLLASWRRPLHEIEPHVFFAQSYVTRIDADGARFDRPVDPFFRIDLIGQAGTAYVPSDGGTTAIDVTSWADKWTASVPGSLIAARPDGGAAAIDDAGDLHVVGPTGQMEESSPLGLSPNSAAQEFDGWIGVKDGELTSVAGRFQDATRWVPELGSRQRNLALRNPGVGIFAKSHRVQWPVNFQHVSVRVTPTAQSFWLSKLPNAMVPVDDYGNHFFTLGAGTAEGDTSVLCTGTLTKGLNRDRDVGEAPLKLERLPVGAASENGLISALIQRYQNYPDDLPYACFPEMFTGAYNSNSFASGLLLSAGAPLPLFPIRGATVPGWPTPVPASKFQPQ